MIDPNELSLSIKNILYPSLNSSLDGISIDIFFYGCTLKCKNCHNYEIQRFVPPNKSFEDIKTAITPYCTRAKVITILGGEPLDQPKTILVEFIEYLKKEFPALKISLYTGYTQVPPELLKSLDYVKLGNYRDDSRTPEGAFLASKNQVMLKRDLDLQFRTQWKYETALDKE